MKSLWNDAEAARCRSDLDLRVYTSRLFGQDASLVLHGGGNTSVNMIAVLARRHGIPFYVAAPLSTVDAALDNGGAIPIEERGASEVRGHAGHEWAPAGVAVRNPVFDITPAELVTALVTEKGVVRAPDRGKIAALLM